MLAIYRPSFDKVYSTFLDDHQSPLAAAFLHTLTSLTTKSTACLKSLEVHFYTTVKWKPAEINLKTDMLWCRRWSAEMWTTCDLQDCVWLFILGIFQPSLVHRITTHTLQHSHSLTWWSHKPCCKCLSCLPDCSPQRQPVLNSPCSLPLTMLCPSVVINHCLSLSPFPLPSFKPLCYCSGINRTEH